MTHTEVLDKTFTEDFYPTIFHNLDQESQHAQDVFFFLIVLQSMLLITVPIFILFSTLYSWEGITVFIPLLMLMALLIILFVLPRDIWVVKWQSLRTGAETIKRQCWLYFMSCDPYTSCDHPLEDRHLLIQNIKNTLGSLRQRSIDINGKHEDRFFVSDIAEQNRSGKVESRMEIYINYRLKDQITWYQKKWETNKTNAKVYNRLLVGVLVFTLIFGAFISVTHRSLLESLDILIAVMLSMQSFNNAKRFADLSVTYQNTYLDLQAILEDLGPESVGDPCSIVQVVEDTISRENEMWHIKRLVAY